MRAAPALENRTEIDPTGGHRLRITGNYDLEALGRLIRGLSACSCHSAIAKQGCTAIIPIRKNGRTWNADGHAVRAKNEILRAARHFGRA